ncbi:alternative oxidase [Colletotrichum tofieldiae]|uniref:Alternative oxidase n=1 Tax=Colletotrichum tofieldiae TaxID=708197 RepID=A0A166WXW9_9PEZI|nr:alternative oxidase [Colletotrichum tofieldiae]GKT55286.1 alternative oxidase [Colletotrichum tofieldiae]GKT75423.1 alternative oxidase [Colletotrichum tofieldiae]
MIGSTSMSQLVKFVGGLVLVFGSLWYLGVSRQHVHAVTRAFRNQRELFIKDFLEHEIDGRFDGTAIQSLCAAKKWTPGLLMSCDEAAGGIGEVRNAHLHCIRFAIEAGAALVLPQIVSRSEDDIKAVNGRSGVPLDYYFDVDHLHHVLTTYCPQMKVYGSMNDLYNVPEATDALQFSISDTTDDWVNGTVMANPHRWHQKFHDFIDERLPVKGRSTPFRVHLKRTQWTWPTATDKAPVTLAFGRMLRIRSDARRLAGSALFTLGSRFGLNLDPRTRYHPASFVGIHLRTEENIDDKYPDYPTQAANYLHYLSESKTNIAFLATGATEDNITAFVERGQDFDVTVVTKLDILDDEEQKVLEKLSWDQRGLVDYEIMLRASRVASVSASAFAWDLALRRSYAFGKGLTGLDLQYPGRIAWKDDYTVLYGKHDNAAAFASTIWP